MNTDASVTLHPAMRSGDPTIGGTRIPAWAVGDMVWIEGVESAMADWDLTREQVLVACWFLGTYGVTQWTETKAGKVRIQGRVWTARWGAWAFQNQCNMWLQKWDEVPDPPAQESR